MFVSYDDLHPAPPRTRSGRVSRPVAYYGRSDPRDFANALAETELSPALSSVLADLSMLTYRQAMRSPDAPRWTEAIEDESKSLTQQRVFTLTPLPPGKTALPSRILFKVKLDSLNQPSRWKARVVAKGFKQRPGVDFFSTFAPVVKAKSLRMLLSIVATRDLELEQLDFDTAFLNAPLEEEVYMVPPEGFYPNRQPLRHGVAPPQGPVRPEASPTCLEQGGGLLPPLLGLYAHPR